MSSTRTVRLADVAARRPNTFVDGPFGSNLKSDEYVDRREVRLVQLQNIGIGEWSNSETNYISFGKARSLARHMAYPGDVVIAKMADPVARACLLPYTEEAYIVVADCIKLQIDTNCYDPRFIVRTINSRAFRTSAEALSSGTTRLRINLSALRAIQIPDVKLCEQKRIADILDSVDEQIHAVEAALRKMYILQAGVIREALAALPRDGTPSTVGNLFAIKAGITLGPHRKAGENASKYLRVANVQRGRIDLSDIAFLQASGPERTELQLAVGDLLVVEGHANSDEIGRCALVGPNEAGLLYQNHLFRLRSAEVDPEFAELWLNSDATRAYWRCTSATSSGLYTINSQMLRALPFPVVSQEAQARVINSQQLVAGKVKTEQAKLIKLRALKQGLMDDLLAGECGAHQ